MMLIRTLLISLIFCLLTSVSFATIQTVDFVSFAWDAGGSSAVTNGGGATRSAWDGGSPSDFFNTTTGAAIVSVNAVNVTTANAGSKLNINHAATTAVTTGSIALIDFATTYTDDYYVVTFVDNENVTIDVAYSGDTTCNIDIGGTINGLTNIINTDLADASSVNCDVLIKGNETTGAITVSTGGGTTTTLLSFIGVDSSWVPIPLTATSGWPEITNSGKIEFADQNIFVRGLKFISNVGFASAVEIGGIGGGIVSCYIVNSNANGEGLLLIKSYAANCYIQSASTDIDRAAVNLDRSSLYNCTIKMTGTSNGVDALTGFKSANIVGCVIYSTGNGTYGILVSGLNTVASPCLLTNNTIDSWADCIHLAEMLDLGDGGSLLIGNNILTDWSSFAIDKTSGDEQGIFIINNAFFDEQTAGGPTNLEDLRVYLSITLTGDPYTNKAGGIYVLDNTAGQGAACRAAGFPGARVDGNNTGYSDVAALQHQDAGGNGGGRTPGIGKGIGG